MNTHRKLRTRRLALDFEQPSNPVSYERGKEHFAKIREILSMQFAGKSKDSRLP